MNYLDLASHTDAGIMTEAGKVKNELDVFPQPRRLSPAFWKLVEHQTSLAREMRRRNLLPDVEIDLPADRRKITEIGE